MIDHQRRLSLSRAGDKTKMHDNFRGEKGVDKNTMSLRLRNLIKTIDLSTFTKLNINSIDTNTLLFLTSSLCKFNASAFIFERGMSLYRVLEKILK